MAIQVPKERSYYYETSRKGVRLFLCLTGADLQRLVEGGGVDARILVDFPEGLDFEVTPAELAAFEAEYGLRYTVNPEALRIAFEAFRRQAHEPFPATGFLPAPFLEDNAHRVRLERGAPPLPDLREEPPERRLAVQVAVQRMNQEAAKELSITGADEGPQAKLLIPRVEMTEGDEAGQRFSMVQQRPRKGGD